MANANDVKYVKMRLYGESYDDKDYFKTRTIDFDFGWNYIFYS